MTRSDATPEVDTEVRPESRAPSLGALLSNLNPGAGAPSPARMTSEKKRRKMASPQETVVPMRVVLVVRPGLFADAFAESLLKLGADAEVHRCDPDSIEQCEIAGAALIVIDVDATPGGAALVEASSKRFPGVPMVALAEVLDETSIATMMKAGARAYLPKSYSVAQALGVMQVALNRAAELPAQETSAGRTQRNGAPGRHGSQHANNSHRYGLTDRELEVLTRAGEGLANLQIAKRLGITEGTVKIHLSNCYDKLGVQSRVQAIRIVERLDAFQKIEVTQAEKGLSLRDWLLPHMTDELHTQGDILFRKGDPSRALYYLQKGRVLLPEIGIKMGEGQLFGEIGIFSPQQTRTCSATCETECRLFCLTTDRAKRLYFENPKFAYHVMQLIAQRLSEDKNRAH